MDDESPSEVGSYSLELSLASGRLAVALALTEVSDVGVGSPHETSTAEAFRPLSHFTLTMFSQLPSQRPQVSHSYTKHASTHTDNIQIQPNHPPNPLYQQQTRNLHVEPPAEQIASPRNQIEAMPPSKTMPEPLKIQPPPIMQPMYNPAVMHPVFMGNFRKAPFPLPLNGSLNPVATGYVFARDRVNGHTKL